MKEEPTAVVCARKKNLKNPYFFEDNMEGTCSVCGETVIFRPAVQQYQKVCLECAPEFLEQMNRKETPQ